MKKLKCISALLLCLGLLVSPAAHAAQGDGEKSLSIDSPEALLEFAENCRLDSYSWGLSVTLSADIDLSGRDFQGIPIFCGSFDGQGHTVSGIDISAEGSVQGFFRYLTDKAVVKDLKLKGTIAPGGSHSSVGALVGENSGRLTNCSFEGEVSGADKVGGIAGENKLSGIIEKCSVSGSVSGSHFVGGITGSNLGVVRTSSSSAAVNTTPRQNSVELAEVTVESLSGTENVGTSTDVGGIAGANQGYIHDCVNKGAVGYRHMGYNIGGIAGSQMGYIASCRNLGDISGRKEVGGIVGQMEPTVYIAFQKDALQLLNEQLNGLAATVGQAGADLESSSQEMGMYAGYMINEIENTGMSLYALGQEQLPDEDMTVAAESLLSSSMSNMSFATQGMMNSAMNSVSSISGTLSSMQGQINEMGKTLGNITNHVGASYKDISDMDLPTVFTGKVEACENMGRVLGDSNVGGIVGAIALENDFDAAEDITLGENSSLKFISELRAVVLSCRNSGDISVNHSAGGGVAGYMQFGLVKDSSSTGVIEGANADHIGGVAGHSRSYIRSSSAKGELTGSRYVGGIAGEGNVVTGCRSMVIISGSEKLGAVLGSGQPGPGEDGSPKIADNYYNIDKKDMGGIDGVSYAGVAVALDADSFMALPGLPDIFRQVKLSFVQEDGSVQVVTVDAGSRVAPELVPEPLAKEGFIASWEGFEAVAYDYDSSFHAVYVAESTTVASSMKNGEGLPFLLAEGSFMPGSSLELYETQPPSLRENEELKLAWRFESSGEGQARVLRLLVGEEPGKLKVFVGRNGQDWQEAEYSLVGSYLVVSLPEGMDSLALAEVGPERWHYAAAAGGVALVCLALLIAMFVSARRRKKAAAAAAAP